MELEKILINEERKDYKCFNLLRELLKNEEFTHVVKKGIEEGMISGFTEEVWTKIYNQNSGLQEKYFDEDFEKGYNIGACFSFAKQLSFSFDDLYCDGMLPWLVGTPNCATGKHVWVVSDGYIYDTSLMLIIDEKFAKEFGYVKQNTYSNRSNPFYSSAWEQFISKEHQSRPRK